MPRDGRNPPRSSQRRWHAVFAVLYPWVYPSPEELRYRPRGDSFAPVRVAPEPRLEEPACDDEHTRQTVSLVADASRTVLLYALWCRGVIQEGYLQLIRAKSGEKVLAIVPLLVVELKGLRRHALGAIIYDAAVES